MKFRGMNSDGFTLMEMMIVVGLIAVLAGIGYPNYMEYVKKTRRSDAKTALMGLQQAQEKLRANCRFYAGAIGAATTAPPCSSANNIDSSADVTINYPATSMEGWYEISIANANNLGYDAIASVVAGNKQTSDVNCRSFIIRVNASNPDGLRISTNGYNGGGTNTTNTANCW